MHKIALHGRPGAGKSTLAGLLIEECGRAGMPVQRLKLGTPLYEAQALVYALAGKPLLDTDVQDGPLLNALGEAMRRINPQALTAPFTYRVQQAEQLRPEGMLICDDMRAPDVEVVIGLGFRLVEVVAPDELRLRRKKERADLAAGDDNHTTERPITATPWQRVHNSGSREDLRAHATRILGEVLR
ncbi:hypothetical protein ACH4VR_36375 [Streptomyces sp. NPDC020883]|uniref:hypothetical protein n=1 Tax=Streptomyces sp. NPDC020883 TaxID=3365099 RepID=UPI00378866BD